MADGNLLHFPTGLPMVETHPQANAYGFARVEGLSREPAPAFEVDRAKGWVVWGLNGLRLVHAPQFRALADLFADNGWYRNFNALMDAELALSAVPPDAA